MLYSHSTRGKKMSTKGQEHHQPQGQVHGGDLEDDMDTRGMGRDGES